MNTKIFFSLLAAVSFCIVAPTRAQETAGEKASDSTKTSSKKATHETASTTKQTAKKGDNSAAGPSGTPQKVDVNLGSTGISLPKTLSPGRFIFTVANTTQESHSIAFEGGSLKNVIVNVPPTQSGTVDVTLTPGTYTVGCNLKDHQGKEAKSRLTVK